MLAEKGVILAYGEYESSEEMRSQHLDPQWVNAYVIGMLHNVGTALRLAEPL